MEPYYTLKMKRKDLEDVYDEFSEFSLSSPARKIRRLDADLPPIIEEVEEPEIPIAFEQAATYPSFGSNAVNRGLVIEELPSVPENEERAIVLFKPMNTQPVHSPSNFSVKVDPQFLNGLKSHLEINRMNIVSNCWWCVSCFKNLLSSTARKVTVKLCLNLGEVTRRNWP